LIPQTWPDGQAKTPMTTKLLTTAPINWQKSVWKSWSWHKDLHRASVYGSVSWALTKLHIGHKIVLLLSYLSSCLYKLQAWTRAAEAEATPFWKKTRIFFQGYVLDRRIGFIEEGPSGQHTTRSTQVSRPQLHAAYSRTARKEKHMTTTRQPSTYPLEWARPWKGLQPSTTQLPTECCGWPSKTMELRLQTRHHSDASKDTSTLICLKRIYNFWCSMLIYATFALYFVTLCGVFMHFPELTY
jgi:hypothetical protein